MSQLICFVSLEILASCLSKFLEDSFMSFLIIEVILNSLVNDILERFMRLRTVVVCCQPGLEKTIIFRMRERCMDMRLQLIP